MAAFFIWLQFLISAALVITGGHFLARNGKELAKRWGLTELWIGFIFLAAVTSIPELATALGAVLVAHSPALALGDILGSNAFNLFIISILNVCSLRRPITDSLSLAPFRTLVLLIITMTGVSLAFMALEQHGETIILGHTSLASWLLLILYLLGSWKLFRDEHPRDKSPERSDPTIREKKTLKNTALYPQLLISVIMVMGGGFWLASTGGDIAAHYHWGQSFVGAFFLALVTSLPELAVCLAAVKMGASEMALGNLLGSNIFNLGIIFWADLAYRRGSLLAGVEPSTYVAGALGIILLLLVVLALKLKPARFFRFLSWDTIAIFLVYLGGMYVLFKLSAI